MIFEVNNRSILQAWWFVGGGVVLVQDNLTYEYHAYVKPTKQQNGPEVCVPVGTSKEDEEMFQIASWGNKIPKASIQGFFPGVNLDETKPFSETNPGYLL